MLSGIVQFSIRHRGIVVALACLLLGYGAYIVRQAEFDVFPEFAAPQVVIQTESPGLSAEQVEVLVTRPLENAINGTTNLESIRSESIQGLSKITAVFRSEINILSARQLIGERIAVAQRQLPLNASRPVMAPPISSTGTVLVLGLTSTQRSLMDLRTFADWLLRPRLLAVAGVANVTVFGGEVRQLQVQVDPQRLLAHRLSITDVLTAASQATGVRGAGFIETGAQRVVLRTESQSLTPVQLGQRVIAASNGISLRLADVSRVTEGAQPMFGDASIGGRRGVVLNVSSQIGASTIHVTGATEALLRQMQPLFEQERITLHADLFRPAKFVTNAVASLNTALLTGGLLVAIVLFLFLFNVRTAFISITAIPLSLLTATILLNHFGGTLNTMVMGGLAIAIGEVVDDAIIDVENIFRRLRENCSAGSPRSSFRVVFDASIEVRSAVVYATFVVALVFLPVLTMSGVQGRIFAPLGIAYIFAILASLLVALTVTPALSYVLLARSDLRKSEPPLTGRLKAAYSATLRTLIHRPGLVVAAAVVLFVAAAATLPLFGGEFLPEFREGHFIVHVSAVPGTSLEESTRLGTLITTELTKIPYVRSVCQRVGRAEAYEDTWGTHYSEFEVDLKTLAGEEVEAADEAIRTALAKFPGIAFAVKQFLTERIEEQVSGVSGEVVIKIFGEDLELVTQKAREAARLISGIRGAADVHLAAAPGAPEQVIRLQPDKLVQFGFQPMEVLDAIQTGFGGTTVSQVYEGNRVFDVVVILDATARTPTGTRRLLVRNSRGATVPISEIADVHEATGSQLILHEGTRRQQVVTCNVVGRDQDSFVDEAKRRLRFGVSFPPGVHAVFAGAAEAKSQAERDILIYSAGAAVAIVLVLAIAFGSSRNLLLVLLNLPFAFVGGVLAAFITGGWLTVGSLVGFVSLFGISMRNSMMLVSHWQHLVEEEGVTWGLDAALRGASERLIPVLMTASVAGLGLLPIALGSGEPGREIEGPMAIVILGGLFTSTVLNLLLLPTLALRYGRFRARDPERLL